MSTFRARRRDLDQSMNAPHLGYSIGWRERIAGLAQRVPLARRPPRPVHQPRQRRHHTSTAGGARRRLRSFCRITRAFTAAPDSSRGSVPLPTIRRTRRSPGSSAPTRAPIRSSSGRTRRKPSTSSPIATRSARRSVVLSTGMEHHSNDLPWRGRAQVVRARVTARRTARRRRRRPAHRGIRRSHRPADGQRGVERHRLRPADPSAGAKSARRRREHSGRRRPIGAAPSNRRQAGSRSRASRFRSVLRSQDVRAVRHRCARWTT